MAKNECGYLGHRAFKLVICYKGINQNKLIFLMVIQMQDIANNWVGMIKSGRDPLYGTLKFAVYNNE